MPYAEPDRNAPEVPSKIERINDFSGGLNTTISGSLLNKNEAQVATNVSFEQKGTLAPLKGRARRYTGPYNAKACSGLGMLFKQDGTSHLVMTADDKVYSDAPRMSYRFTEKPDWEKGTINAYTSVTKTEGAVVVDAGTLGMMHDGAVLTGFSPFSSVAGTTYGWSFKTVRAMNAFKVKWIPLLSGVEYTLTLWEGWTEEGTTAYSRLLTLKKTPTPTEINTIQAVELTGDSQDPIVIQADKVYTLSIHCPSANGISRYLISGTPAYPSYMVYNGSSSGVGDIYPTTTTATTATFYGVTLMLEYLHHEVTVDSVSTFVEGTLVDLEFSGVDTQPLTHAVPTVSCSALSSRLDRVMFDDFTIDNGVLNFLKTTTTNSDNKTGLLYPYMSAFKAVAFPTSTAYVSDTQLTDAQYLTVKDTGTATVFTNSATAGQFSGLKTRFYVPVEIYDKDKTAELSFTVQMGAETAGTKIFVYALPYGGVELGTANTQVLVATFDPATFPKYTVSIKSDPKRFINPTTGAVQLFFVTDLVAKGLYMYSVKMNPTWVEKTTEQLRALLSVGYTVSYGDSNTEVKNISYMTANFGLAKFDKARTSITIGAQSGAYSKAILPVLKVCGKSGLSIVRKALPVNVYVTDAHLTGTKTNTVDAVDGVKLGRQGADTSLSVVKTTGVKVQTVYDAGKDAVVLGVDPSQQSTAGLPGWDYGKRITIPANTVSETLTNFPLTVYLNQSNFDFSKAKPDGTDIRFTDMALNPLKFERVEHNPDLVLYHSFNGDLTKPDVGTGVFTQGGVLSQPDGVVGKCISSNSNGQLVYDRKAVPSGARTYRFSIYPTSTQAYQSVFSNVNTTASDYGVLIDVKGGSSVSFTEYRASTTRLVLKATGVLTLNAWNIVTISTTGDTSANGVKIWVGENLVAQGTLSAAQTTQTLNDMILYNYASYGFVGMLDEFYIYTGAKSPTELTSTVKAKYTVNVPSVSPTGTDILMFYGNPNAYNASMESWRDQTGKALTYMGSASLDASVAKFGNRSLKTNSTDYIKYTGDVIPTGVLTDISIDFQIYIPSTVMVDTNDILVFMQGLGTTNKRAGDFYFRMMKSACGIGIFNGSGYAIRWGTSSWGFDSLSKDTWHHIYMYTNGTTVYLSLDGVVSTITPVTDSSSFDGLNFINKIHAESFASSINIDEIRISNSCRWSANFTPPTTVHQIDNATKFLWHCDTIYDSNYAMVQHMGDSLVDATGNGNNGTATGTTVVNTDYGKARSFNGTSDYITTPLKNNATQFTELVLIKNRVIKFNPILADDGAGYTALRMDTVNPYDMVFALYDTASRYARFSSIGYLNAYKVFGARHLSGTCMQAYSDGANVAASPSAVGNLGNTGTAIKIGKDSTGYGAIDLAEVRYSNIARSDAWIKLESLALKNSVLSISDATFYSYYGTGSFESDTLDFSAVVAPEVNTQTLLKTLVIPSGTTLVVSYKTSADGTNWTAYSVLSTETLPWAKYMRFKADFASDVSFKLTPEFKALTLGYKTGYFSEGYWTSEALTVGASSETTGYFVNETLPTGTGVTLQTRHSADGVVWSAWADSAFNALPSSEAYVQYRAKLMANTDLTLTPVHQKSYVGYSPQFKPSGSWTSPVYDLTAYEPESIELEFRNAFADFIVTSPVTTITSWIKTSYNNTEWTDWQKFDFTNEEWNYTNLAMNPYIQLKVEYASTDSSQTPVVDAVTFREANDLKTAVWTSAPIDVSMAKTLDSGKIVAQYTNGGGTLTLMSRTSPDGITGWSEWANVDASYMITNPPNNFVQVKALFCGYESALNELVLSMDGNASVKMIGSGLSLGTDFSFTTLRDKLLIANGKDALKKWDGTTDTIEDVPNSPPTLKFVVSHHNRVWGVDAENQSRIRYSNILDPEKWDAFDFIDFNPEDGDYITGVLKYGQNVLVSKQRSMALLTGNKSTNYSVSWLEAEQGCSSARGLCQADKYVAYVAQDGIRFTDLANSIVATERVLPNWANVNKRRLSQACVVYWRNKLFVALPTEESLVNNVVWVYDFLRNSWSIREGWSVSSWLKFNQYGEDVLLSGSSETGQVYEVDVTEYDDTIPVEYTWKSKDFHFNAPERYKLFRNIFVDIEGTSDTTTLYVDLIVDGAITGTYTTEIPGGDGVKHSRRILPPLYGAVLGSSLTLQVRGRCGIQGITIEYVLRGAIPGGNM